MKQAFPEYTPLLPGAGSEGGRRARDLLRLERRLFGNWLRWLTSAWCAASGLTASLIYSLTLLSL